MASRSLKKTSLGCKAGKRLGEDFSTFQRGRERICNYSFSKINALRKERSGAYSQKETCLKFSLAKGNVKFVLFRSSREDGKRQEHNIRINGLWVPIWSNKFRYWHTGRG